MPIKITKTLPFPISANRYWRSRAYKARGGQWLSLTYVSPEAKAYKSLIQRICNRILMRGDLKITMDFYRPQRSGDLDNRIKVCIDVLQGVYFEDDKQIVEIHARRFDDKVQPRVEITLEQVLKETPLFERAIKSDEPDIETLERAFDI